MTILEGVIALVVLGLSALGFLDVFRGGVEATSRAAGWSQVVQVAEASLEAASLGDPLQAQGAVGPEVPGMERRVEARAWAPGVIELVVTVSAPGTPPFTVHRLVRERRGAGPQP
jgi:type II secretory pathway pseudopilin PulG